MEILANIRKRRSRRAYDATRTIDRSTLRRLVEAAHLAPSWANSQSWRWILVDESPALDDVRKALAEGNYWALKAPVLAVLVSGEKLNPTQSHNRPYWAFNAGLSAMNLMLQAVEEGLIAHPMAGFDPPLVKQSLGIPEDYSVLLVMSLGYPGDPSSLKPHHLELESKDRERYPLENVLAFNRFENALEPPPKK